jgi:hypothetical protein
LMVGPGFVVFAGQRHAGDPRSLSLGHREGRLSANPRPARRRDSRPQDPPVGEFGQGLSCLARRDGGAPRARRVQNDHVVCSAGAAPTQWIS